MSQGSDESVRARFVAERLLEALRYLRDEPPSTQGAASDRAAVWVSWGDEMLRLIDGTNVR